MYLLPSLAIHQVLTSLQVPLTWLGGCFDFSPTGQPHQTKVVAMEKKRYCLSIANRLTFFPTLFFSLLVWDDGLAVLLGLPAIGMMPFSAVLQ